jgi:hypothetical protein
VIAEYLAILKQLKIAIKRLEGRPKEGELDPASCRLTCAYKVLAKFGSI